MHHRVHVLLALLARAGAFISSTVNMPHLCISFSRYNANTLPSTHTSVCARAAPTRSLVTMSASPPTPYLDRGLTRQLVFNQLAVGYTIWTGGFGAEVLAKQVHLDDPKLWLIGTLGALPILALGQAIEKSDSPLFTTLNLSTNDVVERLLGGTKQPAFALVVSVLLALLTGVCEEIVFRGGILPSLASYAVDQGYSSTLVEAVPFGVVASTVLFSAGHLPFLGLLQGEAGLRNFFSVDTLVLFGLQLATGGSFALIFIGTGSLTSAIVAHFLYDLYTLYATHLAVTDQIAYSKSPLPPLPQQSLAAMKWRMSKGRNYVDEVCHCSPDLYLHLMHLCICLLTSPHVSGAAGFPDDGREP